MREELLHLQLPDVYEANSFEYTPTLDGVPELIDYLRLGYTIEHYKKLTTLVAIEYMKYNLIEAKKDNAISIEEIDETNRIIGEQILKYNSL